jgi:hypothetical protein
MPLLIRLAQRLLDRDASLDDVEQHKDDRSASTTTAASGAAPSTGAAAPSLASVSSGFGSSLKRLSSVSSAIGGVTSLLGKGMRYGLFVSADGLALKLCFLFVCAVNWVFRAVCCGRTIREL